MIKSFKENLSDVTPEQSSFLTFDLLVYPDIFNKNSWMLTRV